MTGMVPMMWSVWGALVLILIALKVYTVRLTRDEDDQLILDDSFNHLRSEQAAIVAKVNKIQPLERATMWLVVAMTVVVIVYYGIDFMNQFK
jgi:heme exporter protein D